MTALAAQDIRKAFGRHSVLAGLDLEIAAGEMVAVVGENGSGKSTLLRILAGDLRPDSGRITVRGRMGYCPQVSVLDEALTVAQHRRYFQVAYGIPSQRRAEELVGRLGCAGYHGQPVGTLSGGTRQKLSLILALMHDPVDNPLANKAILEFFPAYAPTQVAAAGAFHDQILIAMIGLSLAWTVVFAVLAFAVLRLRMPRSVAPSPAERGEDTNDPVVPAHPQPRRKHPGRVPARRLP